MIAGAVGAFGAGLTSEAARWLWATFLAVVSIGMGYAGRVVELMKGWWL